MTSTGTISGSIKWTGLATGTDFGSVVDQLVAIEQRTITRQQTWQSDWQAKLTAINNLDVRLTALKTGVNDYDSRDELLSRAATSSDEKVATISNTSTAATGVYTVECGSDIVEKIGSKTYKDDEPIGGGAAKNAASQLLDEDGKLIGDANPANSNLIAYLEAQLGQSNITYDPVNEEYLHSDGVTVLARYKSSLSTPAIVKVESGVEGQDLLVLADTKNDLSRMEFMTSGNGTVIATDDPAPADIHYPPLTISMGGRTMTLNYDPSAAAGDIGVYNDSFTMADLAESINNTAADAGYTGPDISAEAVYDKTRSGETYSRLVITGGEGGLKNHISVSDPTDLGLDRNSIDEPVTSSWLGSQATPLVDASSSYTGLVNKSITVVTTNYTGNAVLGTDDIQFSWADTEGNNGSFVVRAADWDEANDCLKEPVELLQGVKISFQGKSGENYLVKNEAFTIDCQTPVMQKAADVGLSQTDKWVHQGVGDLTSAINSGGTGTFAYSYAGREYSVSVGEVTLQGLVDKINSDTKNPGVVASVLNDGMGTATSYKLVLTGYKEGAEYGIRILDSTSLSGMPTGQETWSHAREASNSMCRVDGYPNDGVSWIQRQTNEVGDVLDGVVITLQGAGTSQITVQNNVTEMMNKVKQIVEAVNYAKSYIKEQTKFSGAKLTSVWNESTQMFDRVNEAGEDASGNSSSDASGVMIGNYGFQISQSEIDKLMTKAIFTVDEYIKAIDPEGVKQGLLPKAEKQALYDQYLEDNGLIYTRLTDIGIASDPSQQGQYIIEESVLKEAITKNPEAVIKLFTFKPDESMSTYVHYEDEDPRPRIAGFCVNMGFKMSDLTRSEDVLDSDTGEVIQGAKGITKVLAANYSSIISGIDDKIAREEKRIAQYRSRMEEKFSRLETLLAELENQSKSIESQLAQLNTND